jgi:RNA polymerase sigma-70 factor (ECF subfamily)
MRQGLTIPARPITVMRMTTTDEDLAHAAANGDGQAFASLLDRHYDRLFAYCFRMTGQRSEAEDLTQDICAALPAKLGSYQRRAKVTTWLYKVAMNAAHDRRRKQATYSKASDGWGDWETARTATNDEVAEKIDWLTQAMTQLAPDLRDTLALVLDDMTHAAAAEVMGVSEGTISWRISEAKKALKALKKKEDAA